MGGNCQVGVMRKFEFWSCLKTITARVEHFRVEIFQNTTNKLIVIPLLEIPDIS